MNEVCDKEFDTAARLLYVVARKKLRFIGQAGRRFYDLVGVTKMKMILYCLPQAFRHGCPYG